MQHARRGAHTNYKFLFLLVRVIMSFWISREPAPFTCGPRGTQGALKISRYVDAQSEGWLAIYPSMMSAPFLNVQIRISIWGNNVIKLARQRSIFVYKNKSLRKVAS